MRIIVSKYLVAVEHIGNRCNDYRIGFSDRSQVVHTKTKRIVIDRFTLVGDLVLTAVFCKQVIRSSGCIRIGEIETGINIREKSFYHQRCGMIGREIRLQLQPNFAANHTASLVVKRFFTDINTGFNFTYSYATGRPYYLLTKNGSQYQIADQGKTIDYNSLGFSMNYLTSIGKSYAVIVASVTNVLNSNQVFGYNYSHDGSRKESITTAAPRFIFVGLFLSWGVDRRQDAINNNL